MTLKEFLSNKHLHDIGLAPYSNKIVDLRWRIALGFWFTVTNLSTDDEMLKAELDWIIKYGEHNSK
jgi:hypothetical protein